MPILYYPSHPTDSNGNPQSGCAWCLGTSNSGGQFYEADNSMYVISGTNFGGWMPANPNDPQTLASFVWDKRDYTGLNGQQAVPYRNGEYVIIAAGRDRQIGTRYSKKNYDDQ